MSYNSYTCDCDDEDFVPQLQWIELLSDHDLTVTMLNPVLRPTSSLRNEALQCAADGAPCAADGGYDTPGVTVDSGTFAGVKTTGDAEFDAISSFDDSTDVWTFTPDPASHEDETYKFRLDYTDSRSHELF